MGLFDKIFKNEPKQVGYIPRNEMDAWVGIFYACAGADGVVSEVETDTFTKFLVFKSWFNTDENENLLFPYRQAMNLINVVGSKSIIDSCVPFISEDRKETLFCYIVELLLADGSLGDQEKEIIDYVHQSLVIEDTIAEQILQVYFIRNKGNTILY